MENLASSNTLYDGRALQALLTTSNGSPSYSSKPHCLAACPSLRSHEFRDIVGYMERGLIHGSQIPGVTWFIHAAAK